MSTRRDFLVGAPIGLVGTLAACKDVAGSLDQSAVVLQAGQTQAAQRPAEPTPISRVPDSAPTLRWIPKHEELVYTFGGAAPKHRIKSGTRIISWTEDCFDG